MEANHTESTWQARMRLAGHNFEANHTESTWQANVFFQ